MTYCDSTAASYTILCRTAMACFMVVLYRTVMSSFMVVFQFNKLKVATTFVRSILLRSKRTQAQVLQFNRLKVQQPSSVVSYSVVRELKRKCGVDKRGWVYSGIVANLNAGAVLRHRKYHR